MNNNDVHVYPENDIREHITTGIFCPCNPTVTDEGECLLIVHHAFDKREIIEQAVDIMNGENEDDELITPRD